jgi:alpha-beta hydrolase superfamily lysophospholipase
MLPARTLVLATALTLIAAAPAAAAEPKLTVAKAKLGAALHCTEGIDDATRTPLMIVTGTGASGAEAYGIAKPALDLYGAPVCYVDFPSFTTADMQVSVQYLVHGLRVMSRRAGRRVAVFGISQGGLLPRIALTYWPSLRAKVSDVISAAGTQHGTTAGRANCAKGCIPAGWQQAAGSKFLRALNTGRDETPGPTSWTTVRSANDETVQPQTGAHPTSALKGATNILIQDVCPGREVTHIGTALDSVSWAAAADAVANDGPAKVSRLPADVCSHPFAPGLDESATRSIIDAAGGLTSGRFDSQPTVRREPKLKSWAKAGHR